jgi:hypothetical protein
VLLTIILNLQFQILVILHSFTLARSIQIVNLLLGLVRKYGASRRELGLSTSHLILNLEVSLVHTFTSCLNSLVSSHELLVVVCVFSLTLAS